MTRVVQIDGAPGAGKTYTLRQKLEDEARDGLEPDGFWWLNFTNSGREDVEPEIARVFSDADDPENRAKTLHGLALSLAVREGFINNRTVTDQIIRQGEFYDRADPFAEFCQQNGVRYDSDAADPKRLFSGDQDVPTGNKLFAINDYLTQTCKEPGQWRDAPVDIDIPGSAVERLLERWDAFKREEHDPRLYEDGDYVELARENGLVPDVDVLLIDEFQDFAPLEYSLFKQWRDSGRIERIYIAGDPNQSIYSFRGGTPVYFEETDVDDVIDLKESRRCPSDIASVGSAVLAAHPETDPRGFQGKHTGGNVDWVGIRDKYGLRDRVIRATEEHNGKPSVLLLTRTNRQLNGLQNALRDVGIPFEILGARGSVWQGDLAKLLMCLSSYQSGTQAFSKENVKVLLSNLPDSSDRMANTGQNIGGILDRDALEPALSDFDTAEEIASNLQIKPWKRDVLVNALDAPAAMTPREVRIGTMHAAKGLEAPCVFLFAETTENTLQRYSRNPEQAAEEHRTYYVGATRASETLQLVGGYFDGPIAPPIEKARSNVGVVA